MGKSNHEELLGGAPEATSNKQTVEDNLLGRPHVAEKSFAPEAKKDALAPKTPEERFAELQRLTSVYLSEDDEAMLAKAFRFASEAHEGQCRKSGEPFVAHPVEVAIILADLRMDVETLCAALLHDTVEDTSVTRDQVEAEFNPQVAQLVEGVTKITRIEVESLTDEQAATIRKMFVAMSKDIRVIVIKLFSHGDVTWSLIVVPALLIAEVLLFKKWCHKLCPLSAFMSLIAKANKTFVPTIDDAKCLETAKGGACGACGRVCEEGIDPRHPQLSQAAWSECTKCRACVDACPANAITMPLLPRRTPSTAEPVAVPTNAEKIDAEKDRKSVV